MVGAAVEETRVGLWVPPDTSETETHIGVMFNKSFKAYTKISFLLFFTLSNIISINIFSFHFF